jgi:hypothetical protein
MRSAVAVACVLLGTCAPAGAQVSIGINLGAYPDLVAVPGYPVYYAPRLDSNFFFYDGLYWVYAQDRWYASSWYNGPWDMVAPESVPLFVLRVPVRYYRQPPEYFGGWAPEAPPRWGEHWGREWEQRRSGWDQWDRASAPAPAPLPTYQREYSGAHYPRADQQLALRSQNYHYQPREAAVRDQFQHPPAQAAPPQRQAQAERDRQSSPPPDSRRVNTPVAGASAVPPGRAEESHPPPGSHAADAARPPQAERAPQAERGKPPQPGSPGVEDRTGRPEPAAPQRESQPPRSREQTDRPPASAPAQGPKADPEHERDH